MLRTKVQELTQAGLMLEIKRTITTYDESVQRAAAALPDQELGRKLAADFVHLQAFLDVYFAGTFQKADNPGAMTTYEAALKRVRAVLESRRLPGRLQHDALELFKGYEVVYHYRAHQPAEKADTRVKPRASYVPQQLIDNGAGVGPSNSSAASMASRGTPLYAPLAPSGSQKPRAPITVMGGDLSHKYAIHAEGAGKAQAGREGDYTRTLSL